MLSGSGSLSASLTVSPPVWVRQTLPVSLAIAPPPHVDLPATLTTSAVAGQSLRASLAIHQTKPGVLFNEMNWYKGPYASFEDQLSAAMGGSGQADTVAAAIMAGAKGAPTNGVP